MRNLGRGGFGRGDLAPTVIVFHYFFIFPFAFRSAMRRTRLSGSCFNSSRRFLALGGLADAGGTRFTGRDGELSMGAEATFEQPVELDIRVPVSTDITLLKDGSPIRTQTGKSMRHTVDRPGVYRAEARLGNRPWLYTNPIYLRRHPSDQTNL